MGFLHQRLEQASDVRASGLRAETDITEKSRIGRIERLIRRVIGAARHQFRMLTANIRFQADRLEFHPDAEFLSAPASFLGQPGDAMGNRVRFSSVKSPRISHHAVFASESPNHPASRVDTSTPRREPTSTFARKMDSLISLSSYGHHEFHSTGWPRSLASAEARPPRRA